MLRTITTAILLSFLCCGILAYGCNDNPEDNFDKSTVAGNPWPWLEKEAPAANNLCSIAVEKGYFGRILACERLERFFFGLQFFHQTKSDPNIELTVQILKEVTARNFFLVKSEPSLQDELVDILKDFFKMDGGDYWRNGLVSARNQYSLTLWLFDKLDKMTSE